jgi:PAS domain S-box-containing protein
MNSNFTLYDRSYEEGSFDNSADKQNAESADAQMTSMATIMSTPVTALSDSNKNQPHLNHNPGSFATSQPEMQNMSMVDFGSGHSNNFTFDPSLSGNMSQNPNNQSGLSVDTQYANVMNFNPLQSNNSNFASPLDMDLSSPYLSTSAGLRLLQDIDMMNDNMSAVNDMFANQQFASPIMTSPMTGNFGQYNFHPNQVLNQTSSPAMPDQPHFNQQRRYSEPQKPTTSPMQPQKKNSLNNNQATVGPLTLPWQDPPGGWPSTMDGAKPHMASPVYRDVYAPSGFDLMKTLFRVVSRPNPEINLGAVDLSCAFVVCDAKSHDAPIIYCSESFERLTGYTKYEIVGQNCRFLQSPDGKVEAGIKRKYCDDSTILFLKNSLAQQIESQISLINYRKGGQPFMNLLTMIPIRDDDGEVFQFVGFQVDLVENPRAVDSRNPDGTYTVNYQRHESLPPYYLPAPEQNTMSEMVSKDEVTTVLHTIASSGENELSSRMLDKVLLENSDDVIHVLSLKGLFLYLSPSAKKVLEYNPSDLVGTALSSICHPSDIVPVTRELKETQGGNAVSVVFRIRRKSSGYVWFESHGSLHTEQGKGRKCIILVGRERPVYTLEKRIIMSSGGIGDHEIWSKMSTTGMFLFVANHVKQLLDRAPEELVGTNIQAIMRSETKKEFDRVLQIALTGQSVQVKHELMNRRGMVHQAHTWLYPGDAVEGQKPTFLIAQTKLLKYNSRGANKLPSKFDTLSTVDSQGTPGSMYRGSSTGTFSAGGRTPGSTDLTFSSTTGVVISQAGANAMPIGRQDESLASEHNAFDELKTTRSSSWQYELRQLEKRNRALAEEVQALLVSKKKRKRRRGAGLLQKDCANCHTTNTPEWRRGPSGNRDLCNSCGLRWAKQVSTKALVIICV